MRTPASHHQQQHAYPANHQQQPIYSAGSKHAASSHKWPKPLVAVVCIGTVVAIAALITMAAFAWSLVHGLFFQAASPNASAQSSPYLDGDTSVNASVNASINPSYVSPYNPQYMTHQDGRFAYSDTEGPDQYASSTGIDVSEHQGSIDWQAVAQDGIDFAYIRVGYRGYTEGGIQMDAYFEENYQNARDAGLQVGVYFFSQALTEEEAQEEARFVLDTLDGRPIDLCVAFDEEPAGGEGGRAAGLSSQQLQANAQAFCQVISDSGISPMVYGNVGDLSGVDWQSLGLPMWLAQYNEPFPYSWFDVAMWQYTSSGSVAGIGTRVDMNLLFLAVDQEDATAE